MVIDEVWDNDLMRSLRWRIWVAKTIQHDFRKKRGSSSNVLVAYTKFVCKSLQIIGVFEKYGK